jgi:hypothetical protein
VSDLRTLATAIVAEPVCVHPDVHAYALVSSLIAGNEGATPNEN